MVELFLHPGWMTVNRFYLYGFLNPELERRKNVRVNRHIAFVSAFGANQNEQAPLRVAEHLVMNSGVPYTILRPNFFMENFSDGFLADGIRSQNAIYLAAGDGKTSFISVHDIAAAVLAAFQKSLGEQEFDLTGPAALDHAEAAQIISEASGLPIVYHSLSEEQMIAGARAQGMPEPAIGYLAALYGVVRGGFAAAVTSDFEEVIGRTPIGFREFARANAGAWR